MEATEVEGELAPTLTEGPVTGDLSFFKFLRIKSFSGYVTSEEVLLMHFAFVEVTRLALLPCYMEPMPSAGIMSKDSRPGRELGVRHESLIGMAEA